MLECSLVQLDNHLVLAAYDQQRGRADSGQSATREIRSSAARDHRPHDIGTFGRGDQCRRRAGAGAEVAQAEFSCFRLLSQPVSRGNESLREQTDIEPELGRELINHLLTLGEQVQEQCRQACSFKHIGDVSITRTEAAAATSVCERDNPASCRRDPEIAFDSHVVHRDLDRAFVSWHAPSPHTGLCAPTHKKQVGAA